jgi:hypothetical protein
MSCTLVWCLHRTTAVKLSIFLVLYCRPFASGSSTYINIASVAGPIDGGFDGLEHIWLIW